jgi:hypothetical protein
MKLDHWWSDPQTTGVLISEYGKYLASQVRVTTTTTFGLKPAATPNSPTIEHGSTPPVHADGAQSAGAANK